MAKFTKEDLKSTLGINELKEYQTVIRQLLAEFVGTFLYLSIVLYAGVSITASNVTVAFANGLLIASIVQIIGNVSGGYINPAIVFGGLVCGHIKVLKALLYIIVQIVGSIVGSYVAYAISDDNRGNLGATVPSGNLQASQVFGLEFLMTFVLVGVFLSVVDKNRGGIGLGSAPLAIGLSVTACQCSCLQYTGSLNPVRSLGPAIVMDIWRYHWAYWAGPLVGGLVAGLVYKFVFTFNVNNSNNPIDE